MNKSMVKAISYLEFVSYSDHIKRESPSCFTATWLSSRKAIAKSGRLGDWITGATSGSLG